ncbi:uncharacterized protein J3D65DRAFT_694253 [Phyllosticta citribraziliensis]|uniref:Uncharacterized protein n=1 Tax=Phyllosticta citribraziliensis TaxID=989973 RepID=A0ABR1LSM4_9PEZI
MEFPTASIDVAQVKLSCPPAWKTACEASVQIMGNGLLEQPFHRAHRLAWEKDFDDQCGHNNPSRKRKYDGAFRIDNASQRSGQAQLGSISVSRVGSGGGDAGSFAHGSGLATSSVTVPVYTEQISEHNPYPGNSSDFVTLEYDPNEEHSSDSESDSEEEYDSDEELYDEDFEYEPANSHPPWTRTMSPSLNPSQHSTPPEVLKWVYWPPIYDSLDHIRHNIGARYPMIKIVCVKAAMAQISFVDLSTYRFPYGAMGRLRPLTRPRALPYRHVLPGRARGRTPSPLQQVQVCKYPDGSRDKHEG